MKRKYQSMEEVIARISRDLPEPPEEMARFVRDVVEEAADFPPPFWAHEVGEIGERDRDIWRLSRVCLADELPLILGKMIRDGRQPPVT